MIAISQTSITRGLAVMAVLGSLLAGCGGGTGTPTATSSTGSNTGAPSSTAQSFPITLAGTPPGSVMAGSPYAFQPILDSAGGTVTFSITGQPAWANFDQRTGGLSGTPQVGDVGTSAAITIIADNGSSTSSIGPFTITVTSQPVTTGSATLTWVPPTQNTNGTLVNDIAGYYVYYGVSAAAMTQTVYVSGAATTTYVVGGLSSGTYYFTVAAYTSAGTESAPSNVASKTI